MSHLSSHIEDYLAMRRALGFKLKTPGRLLRDFAVFADTAGASTITTDVAVAWAVLPQNASPVWAAQRLSMVRGFARYLQSFDPAAQVPPAGLLPARIRRVTPYIYSDAEVAALMAAARMLRNPLKAATFETLVGLLSVTGMRGSEVMALDRCDLDDAAGLLTVRATKFRQIAPAAAAGDHARSARAGYQARRDRLCPAPATDSLLVSTTGARLCQATVQPAFRRLLRQAGIGQGAPRPRPTIHGLRHSFAVKTCSTGTGTARTCRPACRPCRPTSATSPRPPRTGT